MTMRMFVLAAALAASPFTAPAFAQQHGQGSQRVEGQRAAPAQTTRPADARRQGAQGAAQPGQQRQARPRDTAQQPRGPGASAATPGLSSVLDRPSVAAPRGASRVGDSFARSGPYVSQQQFDRFTRRRGPTDTGATQGISIFGPAGGGGGTNAIGAPR
jgi:hypothetical protein